MKVEDAKLNFGSVIALLTTHLLVYFHVQKCRGSVIKILVTRLKNDMIYDENLRFCPKLRRLSLGKLVVGLENGVRLCVL